MKEQSGTLTESGAMRFVRDLPGPIERVWQYLVDPEKRAEWLCGGTMGERAGDIFVMRFDHERLSHEGLPERYAQMKGGAEFEARITAIDPPRLLAFTGVNEDDETRIELSEEGGRVRLVLVQTPSADLTQRIGTSAGWQAHLAILVDVLKGRKPRGFWTEHDEAERHYEAMLR